MTGSAAGRRFRLPRPGLRRPVGTPRPTLRLRLTLLNGILLIGAGALLLVLAWVVLQQSLNPTADLRPGSRVTLADGRVVDAREYQSRVARDTEIEVVLKGLAALVVISSAGVIGGYVVTGRALRPLTAVTSTARRLTGETMDQRIRYTGPDDEIRELANTFDAMLDRIGTAFESQRRFVANASHELRTPLAVMRTEVDVVLADPESDQEELRRMGRVVREASERANTLVEALLLLARTEAQAGRRLVRKVPTDLAAGVAVALSAVRPDVDRMHLTVQVATPPVPVVGDPSLLERLAGNLVENAVRYNHVGGTVWVRTSGDDEHARLVVGNSGAELDPTEVPGLFEPFRRGGRERTGTRGAGLGLSIVRAVVDAHGGSASARALAGGGLEVTCTLPAAGTTPPVRAAAPVLPPDC
ncbi:sensor histidine kinase [Actinocatenispora rupis]|uniref:histidine kinase n=1 Tax=Actinocatenispora rupis TaxID=519421 RepID=A0A8J3NDF9_9ACTN|nr:HAMP domain-containing sensor histidine kinase [Actinocatenispora rupis]GID12862.1 two-component sensor histidine kinase [Actinocatenispora rupis]